MKATCPCCGRTLFITRQTGRPGFYPEHADGPCGPTGFTRCEGSGWLVEDQEVAA